MIPHAYPDTRPDACPDAHPDVSVILNTYNRASLLRQAIKSIQRQTLQDWELIIVDDASHDSTPQLLERLKKQDGRLRVYRHKENKGLATARNTGVRHARGRYIALHDDDDTSMPHRLQTQVDILDTHPHIDMVSTWLTSHQGGGKKGIGQKRMSRHFTPDSLPPMDALTCMPLPSPPLMGRRHVFQDTRMRPFFKKAEDYDFILRCVERYHIYIIPRILYQWRTASHSHETMSTSGKNLLCLWKYHCAAWMSAYDRRRHRHDTIDTHRHIDSYLESKAEDFLALPKTIKKQLLCRFCRRCLHHALRHKGLEEYQEALCLLKTLGGARSVNAIAPKILFACFRRWQPRYALPLLSMYLQLQGRASASSVL